MNVEHSWCTFGLKECIDVDVNVDNNVVEGHDLIIFVTANSKNVCCNNDGISSTGTCALASACSCSWDQHQLPVSGNVDFCLDSAQTG